MEDTNSSDTTVPPPTDKGTRLKTPANVKQPAKSSKVKGFTVLSVVALTEAEQLKLATKRSLTRTHISQASRFGVDEGIGIIPGVLDVPTYKSDDEEISWKSSEDDDDDDVQLSEYDEDVDDQSDDDSQNDQEDDDDDDQTDSDNDDDEFIHPKLSTHDEEDKDKESFDPFVRTPSQVENSDNEGNDDDSHDTYGDTVTLKRRQDDEDKDEEPSDGSNQGSKRRQEGKETESTSALKEKTSKTSGKSTEGSKSHQKTARSCKSLVELEFFLEQVYKVTTDQSDWNNPTGHQYLHDLLKPLPLIPNSIGHRITPFDHFINNDLKYLRGGASSRKYTTYVTKTNATDYGHIEWIEDLVPRTIDDDKLYKFKEGDFKRLCIQDIEDMLLLLVQKKLTNLTVDERFAFNIFLRMFMRNIVIQRCMEDLQLGVKIYKRKLNLTKPDTYRTDFKRKEAYTAYSNPRGFIYQNKDNQSRLMRINELHKLSNGMLNDVRTALDDRLKGIRINYLPQTIWRGSDKDRAATMIHDIDYLVDPYGFAEITVKDTDGVADIRRPKKVANLSQEEKLRYDSDIRAINIILLGFPVQGHDEPMTSPSWPAQGMSEGLKHGVEHKKTKVYLAAIEAYDPEANTKYVAAFHAMKDLKSDGVSVSVSTVAPQSLAIMLADAATQSDMTEDEASPKLLRSKSLPPMYNLDCP
uniref:Uncharacterized protein n=1 Tax=Tanacetum cinerariifolium TaxID=118510 RepID=A0A6L2KRW3_TANCI|nr:hypothetical protein [Tanacetum cinerariifolium]